MKPIIAFVIRILRRCFYGTPVMNWKITAYLYGRVARLQIGKERYPVISFGNLKLKCDGEDGILTSGLLNGHFEQFTLLIFQELLEEATCEPDAPTCILADIGANIGVFTATAAFGHRVDVYAFEPNPTTYQLLVDNIALNKLAGVTPMNAAVGETAGIASLDISSESACLNSIYGTGKNRLSVPLVSLDEFFAEQGVQPRLYKIDVEGYEPPVLLGMAKLLKTDPLQIILEFHPEYLKRGGKEPAEFLRELTQQFDAIYCLEEIDRKVVPYRAGDSPLEHKILSVGCNLVLVKGEVPRCLNRA